MIDFLIVGGGYAGLMMGAALLKRNYSVRIYDVDFEESPSAITSGIINPVTGRNLVKSWRFNEFRDAAIPFYHNLQEELGFHLWEELKLCRILQNSREWNDYSAKKMMEAYQDVFGEEVLFSQEHYHAKEGFEIKEAYRVNIPQICAHYNRIFDKQRIRIKEKVDPSALIEKESGWQYQAHDYKQVIFCEGARGASNPFFSHVQYILAAGEFLLVEIPHLAQPFMLSQHKVLVPYGNNQYWFGATFRWDLDQPIVTEKGKKELVEELDKMIKLPYKIIQHGGAVRPTIKDRRPALGPHHQKKGLHLFNGFGTKAASMIPFYINQYCEVLEGNTIVEKEVSHTRFL